MKNPFANPGEADEHNPDRLRRGVETILSNRFASVSRLADMTASGNGTVDLVLLLDMQVNDSMMSFSTTTVDINGIFFDTAGTELVRVSGNSKNTVPYPAFSVMGKTINAALAQFQKGLDNSTQLAGRASQVARTRPPQTPQTMAASPRSQAAPLAPRFAATPLALNFPRGQTRPDDIAVIIGNANYGRQGRDIPDVIPAYADAQGFKHYATTALGIREGNIIDLRDATGSRIVEIFGSAASHRGQLYDWVRAGVSNIYVYYSGHGAPGQDGNAYLVPVDANAQRIDLSGYPLNQLYANLGKLPAKSVTVILEACFSGVSQAGSVISNASPVFLKTTAAVVPPKVTVISAGRANQIASWEKDKSHGLFTKYYLTAMSGAADKAPYGNGDGRVDYDELGRYFGATLTYYARRYYGRDQTSQIVVGGS